MASAHIPMWNIDAPVGRNKPNKQDDVRLVQTMLIALITSSRGKAPVIAQNMPRVTGTFDGRTEDIVRIFQSLMNKKYPGRYPPDGIVSPIHSPESVDWTARSPNGTNSTMVALNLELRAVSRETHQSIGAKLAERLSARLTRCPLL